MTRQISPHGLAKLKQWEGLKTNAYQDSKGEWTIGYGHTAMAGLPKPHKGMVITEREAEELLLRDLTQYENAVEQSVKVKLNDNQYAALVSFTYNVGIGAFKKSTLLKKLNTGNFDAVPSELMKWVYTGKEKNKGLARRRRAEGYLWIEGGFVSSKDVEADVQKINPVLKPEVIGPVVSATSGLTGFAAGSGPIQWALAAIMVIGVCVGAYYFIKRMREAEA